MESQTATAEGSARFRRPAEPTPAPRGDGHPSQEAPRGPNVWLLQHGPCWCRGLPGDSGSFDLIRFRTSRFDLGDMGLNLLIVSERLLDGSGPTSRQVFDSIPDPKVVVSTGVCPAATRFWDEPLIAWTPASDLLPVDVSIGACIFGEPEALLEPVLSLSGSAATRVPTPLSKAGSS